MVDEAKKHEITVLGFSSDADPRLLKAMREKAFSASEPDDIPLIWAGWYVQEVVQSQSFIQDTHHIGTKLKTRLTKPSVVLRMGNYTASSAHLRALIGQTSKLEHRLSLSDLDCADKMSFQPVEKLTQACVIAMLDQIPNANATKAYLQIMKDVLEAFLSKDIAPSDRVYLMWRSVFFLRLWRLWLEQNGHSLKNSFITSFTYYCVELNAHALISVMRKFRALNLPQYFFLWLFNSQACEAFFRSMRSFTSTFSTVVNFDLYELLQRIRRIQLKCELMYDLNARGIMFPRESQKAKSRAKSSFHDIPSDSSITASVKKARDAAVAWVESLGMCVRYHPLVPPPPLYVKVNAQTDSGCEPSLPPQSSRGDENAEYEGAEDPDLMYLNEKVGCRDVIKNDSFVIYDGKSIRKSTLCWLLNSYERVSSDRLLRFVRR